MIDFLYNIFIFPLVQIIEITFVIVYRIFGNEVISIIGVSAIVTLCTIPLYFVAEKWQQAERDLQKKLKPKTDKIKAVFKGDEQYMVLSAYYRQNHYHPIYALRNSFGILIQIPFFIAAYSYLSHLENIRGISFLFISDLGSPDSFLSLGGLSLNILPILMTLINCVSGAVYTKGLTLRDKVQVYGIALVFLILLYNSPAGLVLYWTMNNIFSLTKNILSRIKHWKKIVYVMLCLCAVLVIVRYFILILHQGIDAGITVNRLFVIVSASLFFFIPLFVKPAGFIKKKFLKLIALEQCSITLNSTYVLSALILLVLCGLVIPGTLIASSVQEFSFLDSYTSPLPFIGTAFVQAMGIFIFWPLCIYFLFSKKVKCGLSLILSLLCITALVNLFIFPFDYGDITTTFSFSRPVTVSPGDIIISSLVTLGILTFFTFLLLNRRRFIFHSFQLIVLAALVLFSINTIYNINKDFNNYANSIEQSSSKVSLFDKLEPVYHFSKNGKNVVVFMLDAAVSGYVPYIFKEKPEILPSFSGFTYYPNCVSFGGHTRVGMPVIFGGYEYKPENIQETRSYAMKKHNEALLMMPLIFSEENYRITVTDPTLANYGYIPDLSIFDPYPEISVQNIKGHYTSRWLHSHPELKLVSVPKMLKEYLIRFSYFKIAPPIFRVLIYDKTKWLKPQGFNDNGIRLLVMDSYTTLDYLPQLTEIDDDTFNTYIAITNDLTHDQALFQFPDYTPAVNITNTGNGPFAKEDTYHSIIASFLLLEKWLRFLQEQGVYDNTRIIIVSDHGRVQSGNYEGNIRLPNGEWLSRYHSLLLVKDFNSGGDIVTDTTFMTHGDVPLIAMEGLIDNPENPFSGNPVQSDKENGIVAATSSSLDFVIKDDQWLYVHDDIFNPSNWKNVKK